MKNLLNIVLIASVLLAFGCKEEKPATTANTIESKVEQTLQPKPAEKPLRSDLIQKINTTGEVDGEAIKGKKIDIEKVKFAQKQTKPQKATPKKEEQKKQIQPTSEATSQTTTQSKPKAVQIAEKAPVPAPEKAPEKPALPAAPSHSGFDKLLKSHVSASGVVDYKTLKGKHAQLKSYLSELSQNSPQSHWSRNEKLAYWINAYNAHTIDLILKNYPLKSITDLDGGSPWKVSRIEIDGKKYSLDQIENKIIRPQFKDGRIHFAVNCAAKSCPSLLNSAFLPSTLNAQLAAQTKKFVNNAAFNSISENSIVVSKIFEWYAADFGDLISFLNKYSSTKISPSAEKKFMEYDWSLNGK